jgi:sugar-specific transcriptional regulator TrmB
MFLSRKIYDIFMSSLVKYFTELGFNLEEAKVYSAIADLQKEGKATLKEILKLSKVSKQETVKAISELKKQGLVSSQIKDNVEYFSAIVLDKNS